MLAYWLSNNISALTIISQTKFNFINLLILIKILRYYY